MEIRFLLILLALLVTMVSGALVVVLVYLVKFVRALLRSIGQTNRELLGAAIAKGTNDPRIRGVASSALTQPPRPDPDEGPKSETEHIDERGFRRTEIL